MTSLMPESLPVGRAGACRRGAVVGMFDGVHLGHRFLLDTLARECDSRGLEPLVFTFPSHPLKVINPTIAPCLLSTPAEKLLLLGRCGFTLQSVGFLNFDSGLRSLKAAEFIAMLHNRYRVDFLLRGFNNRFGTERDLTADDYRRIAAECGVELIEAPCYCHPDRPSAIGNVCSSTIRTFLAESRMDEANRLLGYTYSLSGTVGGGRRIGRTIGFPTANIIPPDPSKLIPGRGAYICRCTTAQGDFPAMVNIGHRPTVEKGREAASSIEANLIGFNGDLYGQTVRLEFYSFLRPEQRFESINCLASQLEEDRRSVLTFFTQNRPNN